METYIVIPTYNEVENLERLIKQIFKFHSDFKVIIIDDNSPDGTGKVADIISRKDPRVFVINRPRKAGLGTAYIEGFKMALAKGAELIFEMDADFSHNPKYLKHFLRASEKAQLIIGSRYVDGVRVEGWRFRRLLLSKFANMYVSYIMVRPVWDFTAGFRCYHRAVLESIDLNSIRSDGYAFQIEMTYLTFENGFKVIEIPILFRDREHGYSKISRNVVWEAFWLTLKCRAPILKILRHLSFLFLERREYTEFVEHDLHNLDE